MKKIFLLAFIWLSVFKLYASDTTIVNTTKKISGAYKCGDETIYFDTRGNTFYLKRFLPKIINDVIVPFCYDTIAEGNFKVINNNVIALFNNKNYHKVYYGIKQEKKLSEDTIYFKIVLPNDDAFFARRFRYSFYFDVPTYQKTFDNTFVPIPKNVITNQYSQTFLLSLLIKDLNPLGRVEEAKCYQRTSFNIFNSVEYNLSYNYFTITLLNFNECFVERMDVDNDLIYFNGENSILWRGKEYKKVKDNR